MKALMLSFALVCFTAIPGYGYARTYAITDSAKKPKSDSVKLLIDGEHAYYQKAVKVDSNIRESQIFTRTLQFMASKNFQQNYGYQEEGKLIFTTAQDLNTNRVYVEDDNETLDPYAVQFAISIDMKNGIYRYTINNVVFFIPAETGNKRETLYDEYLKETNTGSRRIAKEAKKLIDSFEKYLTTLTDDLYEGIEQKSIMYKSKF